MHDRVRNTVLTSVGSRAPAAIALTAVSLLIGCGDHNSADKATPQESLLSARVVAATETPNLYHCLSEIGDLLRKNPGRAQVSLACATGTYPGQTVAGRPCKLQIDGENSEFRFVLESETVRIKLEEVAHLADGSAVHNLEDASAPGQPGIELKRFTGAPTPITEALILRFQGQLPALPQMIYQRISDGAPTAVLCRFGA